MVQHLSLLGRQVVNYHPFPVFKAHFQQPARDDRPDRSGAAGSPRKSRGLHLPSGYISASPISEAHKGERCVTPSSADNVPSSSVL